MSRLLFSVFFITCCFIFSQARRLSRLQTPEPANHLEEVVVADIISPTVVDVPDNRESAGEESNVLRNRLLQQLEQELSQLDETLTQLHRLNRRRRNTAHPKIEEWIQKILGKKMLSKIYGKHIDLAPFGSCLMRTSNSTCCIAPPDNNHKLCPIKRHA